MCKSLGIIGCGKMAKLVYEHSVAYGFAPLPLVSSQASLDPLIQADVWIDFSRPDGIESRIDCAARYGIPLVIGTTGWHMEGMRGEGGGGGGGGGVVYSPNFSRHVRLWIASIVQVLEGLCSYRLELHEEHDVTKRDAPSGTALYIASHFSQEVPIHVHRVPGAMPMHRLVCQTDVDTLEFVHRATSRIPYAQGALAAAVDLCADM